MLVCVSSLLATPYTIQSVNTSGLVEVGSELVVENKTYRVNLPVKVSTTGNSEFSGRLQNEAGIYIDNDSIVQLVSIDKSEDYKSTKPVIFLFAELIRGNVSYCSSDKLDGVYKLELAVGTFKLMVGDETTFAILNNKLYVVRGKVRIGDTIISDGQSSELVRPIQVKKLDDSLDVSKMAIEACMAKTLNSANPQSTNSQQTFPIQPINPDIVSPSS